MQVVTHEMDPRIARIHYIDYRKKVREHREARRRALEERANGVRVARSRLELEDAELAAAYRAMSLGKRVLNIAEVMRKAGVDQTQFLPRLAVSLASAKKVTFSADSDRVVFKSDDSWKKHERLELPGVFPAETTNDEWRVGQKLLRTFQVHAIVPIVPAHFRPSDGLEKYHLLWEAKWERKPTPPQDPILLKSIGLHTFVVLAQWDLTPLEQAVLESGL